MCSPASKKYEKKCESIKNCNGSSEAESVRTSIFTVSRSKTDTPRLPRGSRNRPAMIRSKFASQSTKSYGSVFHQ